MKLINLETGIIFDGYEFDDAIEFPHVVSIGIDGNIDTVKLVPIDDVLIATIIILNKKGYETLFSCAGHVHDGFNAGYIHFKNKIFSYPYVIQPTKDIDLFNNENVYIEDPATIRAKRGCTEDNGLTTIELVEAINDFNSTLLKWALALPKFEEPIENIIIDK